VKKIALAVMLFAVTPAAAGQLSGPRVDSYDEQLAVDRKAIEDKVYGDSSGVRYTFCAAFTRGLTLGLSEVILRRFDDGFPVLGDASKINPRASMAGTALGFLSLVFFSYPLLSRVLWRKRVARKRRERSYGFDEPAERETIVGSFVTRDGYEFVVTRSPRKFDN
jgi:hypothetical protein